VPSPSTRALCWASLFALAACSESPASAPDVSAQGEPPSAACAAPCASASGSGGSAAPAQAGAHDASMHVDPVRSDGGLGHVDASVAGSLDGGAASDAALGDGDGLGANGRPPGVALCYTELSSGHAATQHFWTVFRAADLDARAGVIDELAAAAAAYPDEEEFALLLGLADLWRVAEPLDLEALDPLLTLDAITAARTELERAFALCPTDYRLTAWLAPIKVRMGRMLDDAALVQEGFDVLAQGVEHYPGFVLFSKLLVYADLPADDPDFLNAVDAVRQNVDYCGTPATGLSRDPACNDHPHAAHNIEGASVFMGDMYAKAQDADAARNAYRGAMLIDGFAGWDYQQLLTQRIATLDARMQAAKTADTLDDLEPAWASTLQCSLCHRD
jgi:hypothetical protein